MARWERLTALQLLGCAREPNSDEGVWPLPNQREGNPEEIKGQ